LLISTDFWKESVPVSGNMFGQPDEVLSPSDIESMLDQAQALGFRTPSLSKVDIPDGSPAIEFGGLRYTFLYMSLQKATCEARSSTDELIEP
jgi:hypothetical protein